MKPLKDPSVYMQFQDQVKRSKNDNLEENEFNFKIKGRKALSDFVTIKVLDGR